jgi:hypothetical protein
MGAPSRRCRRESTPVGPVAQSHVRETVAAVIKIVLTERLLEA